MPPQPVRAAELSDATAAAIGDPTELALLELARVSDRGVPATARAERRRAVFHFDAHLKRMSTLDAIGSVLMLSVKGAPETVTPLCTSIVQPDGEDQRSDDMERGSKLELLRVRHTRNVEADSATFLPSRGAHGRRTRQRRMAVTRSNVNSAS